jgi:P63C domain
MSQSIVAQLPESIAKEFSLAEDGSGKGAVSWRGLGRLCGAKRQTWGQGGSNFTNEIDQYLAQSGLDLTVMKSDRSIPDLIASEVIAFYAEEKQNPVAKKTNRTLRAFGLRAFIQKTLNYQPVSTRKLSQAEIIELCCLPVPSDWQRRFPEEYYDELSRLTGLSAFGNSRPARWAQLTKELVYDYLPSGIYDEVKRCKEETGAYEKLHQFLSTDGLKILENHQRQLLTLMVASSHLNQLKTLLNQSRGVYQVLMF